MLNINVTTGGYMAEFYLVRHGQASFGKANYDKLSDLGYQQSKWLGEYFRARDIQFDGMVKGDLRRHHETGDGICEGLGYTPEITVADGLNEFDFQSVAAAHLVNHPQDKVEPGAKPAEYYRLLKKAMLAWSAGELDRSLVKESWADFEGRVEAVLNHLANSEAKRVLVVTSGGAIAMMLRHILGYDAETVIKMNLQIKNASFSQCFANPRGVHLGSFNNIPHLDHADRQHAITYS